MALNKKQSVQSLVSYFVAATPQSNLAVCWSLCTAECMQRSYPCNLICIPPILFYWSWLAVASTFGSFFALSDLCSLRFACACRVCVHALWQLISGPWFRAYEAELSLTLHFHFPQTLQYLSFFFLPSTLAIIFFVISPPSSVLHRHAFVFPRISWLSLARLCSSLWPSLAPVALRSYLLTHFSYYCHPLFFPLISPSFVASRCRMECSILVM